MAHRRSIASRLAIGAALIALVPLGALALIFLLLAQREIRKQLDAALMARAQSFAGLVQSSILEPLARDNALNGWVVDPRLTGGLSSRGRDACNAFLAAATRGRVVVGAELLDASGMPLCSAGVAQPSQVPPTATWFKAAVDGALASQGVVRSARGPSLTLAKAVDGGDARLRGVLRAWYDWAAIQQMIETVVAQARRTDDEVQLQIAVGERLLFDTAGSDGAQPIEPGAAAKGLGEQHEQVFAWTRNDVAATDPGGGFAYVARLPRSAAFASLRRLLAAVLIVAAAAALSAAVAAWLLSRRLVRPLESLGAAMERIVREGDLTQKIESAARNDEIGRLATSFATLVEKLRELPHNLRESASTLSAEVARLDRAVAQQNEGISRQAAALQETQVTAQEIRQTSIMAAQKADTVLGAARRAEDVGRAGHEALEKTLGEMGQILGHVEAITRTISELGESTTRIAGIAGLVKDLADQSNMLALNAAIEAVRSGEHGRGFSVVAREIRNLADQSIEATRRVQENVDGIRGSAARAVGITEQGTRAIGENLNRLRASGESLRELGAISTENANMVREIAAAVAQQNGGVDQVFAAIRDLSSSMEDLLRLIEQNAASVREVSAVSTRIGGIVSSFRT